MSIMSNKCWPGSGTMANLNARHPSCLICHSKSAALAYFFLFFSAFFFSSNVFRQGAPYSVCSWTNLQSSLKVFADFSLLCKNHGGEGKHSTVLFCFSSFSGFKRKVKGVKETLISKLGHSLSPGVLYLSDCSRRGKKIPCTHSFGPAISLISRSVLPLSHPKSFLEFQTCVWTWVPAPGTLGLIWPLPWPNRAEGPVFPSESRKAPGKPWSVHMDHRFRQTDLHLLTLLKIPQRNTHWWSVSNQTGWSTHTNTHTHTHTHTVEHIWF